MTAKVFISINEIVEETGLSRCTIARQIKSEELASKKVGTRRLVYRDSYHQVFGLGAYQVPESHPYQDTESVIRDQLVKAFSR